MGQNQKLALGLLLSALFCCRFVSAQTCIPVFQKFYGGAGDDEALDIVTTADKGSIVAGRSTSGSAGGYDGFLLKLDEGGNLQWNKVLGGSGRDELLRVQQTAEGGYIAMGHTQSFSNPLGEAWLVRLDAGGAVLWTRHLGFAGKNTRPKEIIRLSDGGYALVGTVNEGTGAADGVVSRLDASGSPLWTQVFDKGGDDGFLSVLEVGETLYAGGYTSGAMREGVLVKLLKADGSLTSTRKFFWDAQYHTEVTYLEKIAGGVSFGVSSYYDPTYLTTYPQTLTLFKMDESERVYFQRRAAVGTYFNLKIEALRVRTAADGGYAFIYSDTTAQGYPELNRISPSGNTEWSRRYDWPGKARLYGFDLTGEDGYILGGYFNNARTGYSNKISIFKTDRNGRTGDCTLNQGTADYVGASDYRITDGSWRTVGSALFATGALQPVVNATPFTTQALCEERICAPGFSIPESCLASFYFKYKGEYKVVIQDVAKVDDGYVLAGAHELGYIEPLLVKLKANGDVQWSQTFNRYASQGTFTRVLQAPDGHIIATQSRGSSSDFVAVGGGAILKVNKDNGAVIWSKEMDGNPYDIKPDNSGGFIVINTSNYGTPPTGIEVYRIDGDGNVLWQKKAHHFTSPIFKSVIVDGASVYVGADYYMTGGYPNSIQLSRFELATGRHLWTKRYMADGESTRMESIYKLGDTLVAGVKIWTPPYYNPGILKFDENGEQLGGFKILGAAGAPNTQLDNEPWVYPQRNPSLMTKTVDNHFVFGYQGALNGSDTAVNLFKVSSSGAILWARKYDNLKRQMVATVEDDGGSLLLAGRTQTGSTDAFSQYESFFMRTTADGVVVADGSAECHNVPASLVISPIKATVPYYAPTIDSVTNGKLKLESYTPINRVVPVYAEAGCFVPASCTGVAVVGTDRLCPPLDTMLYRVERNEGCTVPVLWQVDTTVATVVGRTDTTIKLWYKKSATTPLIARLNAGCQIFTDTLWVTVVQGAAILSLGPDTSLCPGNRLTLNARKGYASYEWQDGSIDSTFTVQQPGSYHVAVTDGCGNTFRDTVVVGAAPPIPFDAGPDRVKCNGDTVHLTAPAGFRNYSWAGNYNISSPDAQSVVVNPLVDTAYFVRAEKTPGCFAYDTVRITVHHSPAIDLGRDTSFCRGDSLWLYAGNGFSAYQWSNGAATPHLVVNAQGLYAVKATTAEGCTSTDTLRVIGLFAPPVVRLDDNDKLCVGSSRTLEAGVWSRYQWHDGSTAPTFSASGVGTYFVRVEDENGCTGSDTVRITEILPLPSAFLPRDTALCSYSKVELRPAANYKSYTWNTSSVGPSLVVDKPGVYWLEVKDANNCTGRDSIVVRGKECMSGLYVPSAFSPNRDGRNDSFRPMLFGNVVSLEFTVYNRWGEIVFASSDRNKGWDGSYRGRTQDSNVFVWICRYQLEGEEIKMEKGTVMLIR